MSERSKTRTLATSPLFRDNSESLTSSDGILLSYKRAKAIASAYDLSAEDVLTLSPKYWKFHTDPALVMDGATGTLLTIHFNLCIGTLAMHYRKRSDLKPILQQLLSFEVSGQYCLTEVGHGLDAFHLETTATMQSNGNFILHTPSSNAAKFMPPTVPCGIPCVAIVFARLIVDSADRGIKPFVVPIHDGEHMYSGVQCRAMTQRGGSNPVDHAMTSFNHVRLPNTALLGSTEAAKDPRSAFFLNISRVITGTLCMGAFGVSAMGVASCIGARYSLRRRIMDPSTGSPRPIISFSTQFIPVLSAIARSLVFNEFCDYARALFVSETNPVVRHCVAAIFKATVVKHAKDITLTLGDQCGAQGLFSVNQLSSLHANLRGAAIAEGDLLAISIRFGMEILLGRVSIPPSKDSSSLLARHETALISELRALVSNPLGHRSATIQTIVLPRLPTLIETIGHRMAFEAATQSNVDGEVMAMFIASVIKSDVSWYIANGYLSRADHGKMEAQAAVALLPRLEELLAWLDNDDYVTAPMTSDEMWDSYVQTLKMYCGQQPVQENDIFERARL
ncbi:acyl-CoA dehydrogenase NM domain-like protein [Armillaria luteobubalina]|uniref:Acyl-CoA dehydrogenase NM domain-like protein n=1 Tax=Armillaria luteobubalina TaxID=153913 RepID=A0AA39Q467_9AGAR|nr:acyl-CoA dehydrogenase NM domain-like protein [Armillaria luteobubalina]